MPCIKAFELPEGILPSRRVDLYWHRRDEPDLGHTWMRSLMLESRSPPLTTHTQFKQRCDVHSERLAARHAIRLIESTRDFRGRFQSRASSPA